MSLGDVSYFCQNVILEFSNRCCLSLKSGGPAAGARDGPGECGTAGQVEPCLPGGQAASGSPRSVVPPTSTKRFRLLKISS